MHHVIVRDDTHEHYGGTVEGPIWTDRFEAALFPVFEDAVEMMEVVRDLTNVDLMVVSGPPAAEIYQKYIDLVRYVTHRMKLERYLNEAESRLALLIMTRWDSYDACRSRRTTWVARKISYHLSSLRMSEAKSSSRQRTLPRILVEDPNFDFLDLSTESQIIVEMIRDDPEECRKVFSRSNRKEKFMKHIVDRGWSDETVNNVMQELEEMVS
jgi:hypothetical protein